MVLYPKIRVMNRELKGITSEKKTNPCEFFLSTKNSMNLWIIPTQKMVRIPQKKTPYNSLCPFLGWFSKVVGDLQLDLGGSKGLELNHLDKWLGRAPKPPKPKRQSSSWASWHPLKVRDRRQWNEWNSGFSGFGKDTKKPSQNSCTSPRQNHGIFFWGWEKNPEESSQWFGPDW